VQWQNSNRVNCETSLHYYAASHQFTEYDLVV